jgi:hypothetical protein
MNYTRVIPFCQLRQDELRVEIFPLLTLFEREMSEKSTNFATKKILIKGDGKVLFTRYVAILIDDIGFNDCSRSKETALESGPLCHLCALGDDAIIESGLQSDRRLRTNKSATGEKCRGIDVRSWVCAKACLYSIP